MVESEYQECGTIPNLAIRKHYWEIAKGLQEVDRLKTSKYLDEIIATSLETGTSTDSVIDKLDKYYHENSNLVGTGQHEADIVSARIERFLETGGFKFSLITLKAIHKALFSEVLESKYVGVWREVNMEKREDVLLGRSVQYGDYRAIEEYLEYDFDAEKKMRYDFPFGDRDVSNLCKFTSGIWQTHPFREGNTRTTAVFLIMYLRQMGFEVTNAPFDKYSRYFRDALVRSNFADIQKDIQPDMSYLKLFFDNLLLDAKHDLTKQDLVCHALEESLADRCETAGVASRDTSQTIETSELYPKQPNR
jgi:fido (protein-threonine AMPylation protein)